MNSSRFSNSYLTDVSIPFFFEPNFDTVVAPLEAARRIQEDLGLTTERHHTPGQIRKTTYKPTVYGDFLLEKVRNNFATGGGKYD